MSVTSELERLLSTLGAAAVGSLDELESPVKPAASRSPAKDAIDAVLAAPDRATAVASLRHSEIVEAFRSELTSGLIRVDTANQLLRLVNEIVIKLL